VDDQEMDDRLMLGWRGFEQAEHQLIDEIRKNEDPLVPLANLLQWAYAIDQWYKNRIADGEKELLRLFGMDSVGETYNGFRAARRSVAHDLSLVADLVTRPNPQIRQARGAGNWGSRILGPPVVSEWLWTQTPDIPANNRGLPSYKRHLAGRPISGCLPSVREFLEVHLPDLLARKPAPP
jgi:hypothetical protein